jgi:hypothetical protein
MRRLAGVFVLTVVGLALVSSPAMAQRKMGHFSFGASLPQGDATDFVDDGWAIHGGVAMFSPKHPDWGLRFDLGLDWWDIKDSALDQIDTDPSTPVAIEPPDDGDIRIWQLGTSLMWNPETQGKVGFYMLGGVDVDYARWNFSEDGVAYTYWCDWWWGYCYPTLVGGEFIVEDGDEWEWGAHAGAGITFKTGNGEIYLEGIYHWLDTDNDAQYIPISLGYRW